MDRPSLITQWLNKPDSFTENDHEELNTIISKYPFFAPARFVDASNKHKHLPFEPSMMNRMQLFQGNWLLFYEYLDSCEVFFQKTVTDNEAPTISEAPEVVLEHETPDTTIIEHYEPVHEVPTIINPVIVAPQEIPMEVMAQGQPLDEVPFASHEPAENQEPVVEAKPIAIAAEPIPQTEPIPETIKPVKETKHNDEFLKPLYSEDYFLYQGIEIPENNISKKEEPKDEKSLMVMMSFTEWLMHFKTQNDRDKQEKEDKKALKSMWQKEKLAAALEEENEVIPENVFNMAVNSITKEDGLASESLAEVLHKQGKIDKAIDMYKKLSLLNPQKRTYFATKIEQINKQIES